MAKPEPYRPPVDQLLVLGEPRNSRDGLGAVERWRDYRALGLSEEDADELVRLVSDRRLHTAREDSPEVWAGMHAWRALGQLRTAKAVGPLLGLLDFFEKHEDDWGLEEAPLVLGMIGAAAIGPAVTYLADATHGLYARIAASAALCEVGKRHPDCREACVRHLTDRLADGRWNDPEMNGFLVAHLLELGADEAAPVIKRAFALRHVDPSIVGDWEDVWEQLGEEGL